MSNSSTTIRSALFVDFDNVFLGLEGQNRNAGRLFATDPMRWVAWFERGGHVRSRDEGQAGEGEAEPRRILIRRCYLNPVQFGRFRSYFTRAAFNVVDCPPLTTQGKNSADIYMVLDILDTLQHPSAFDEFIILSADADFTPVLLRLRAHDRHTTVMTPGLASAAYRSACDITVPPELFIEGALGFEDPAEAEQPEVSGYVPEVYQSHIAQAAALLLHRAEQSGPLAPADLPPLFATLPSFRNSDWFGFFSLNALVRRLIEVEPRLTRIVDRATGDYSIVAAPGAAMPAAAAAAPSARRDHGDLAERILELVRRRVEAASGPVILAAIASEVHAAYADEIRATLWVGHGTFKAFIAASGAPDLALLSVQPGYIYDPARDDVSNYRSDAPHRRFDLPPELAPIIGQVSSVTGVPSLPPQEYSAMFEAIGDAGGEEHDSTTALSRRVRDLCQERGAHVSRASINFVLTGFRYRDQDLPHAGSTAAELAEAWLENVKALCSNAQMELSDEDHALLRRWIVGGVGDEAPGADTGDAPTDLVVQSETALPG